MLKTLTSCVNNLADQIQKSPANDTLRGKRFCGLTDVQMLALLGALPLMGAILFAGGSGDDKAADKAEATEAVVARPAVQQTPVAQQTPAAQQAPAPAAQQSHSVAENPPAPAAPHKEIPSGLLPLDGAELCLRTVYALDKVVVEDMEIATSKQPSKYQVPDGIYAKDAHLYAFANTMVYLGAEERFVPAAEMEQDTGSEFVNSFKPCYFSPAAPLPADKVVVEDK